MGQRLLAIDTATTACSVALFENDQLVASEYDEIGRGHAEKLIPMIAALPNKGRASHIMVNCGPGSFTGARIGISAARALSLAWGAGLQGYQCLQLIASQEKSAVEDNTPLYVCMHAGHGEFFVQNYSKTAVAMDDLESLSPSDAIAKNQSTVIVGSGSVELAEAIESTVQHKYALPDATNAILLSDEQLISTVAPIYVRAPDAKKPALQ